MLITAFKKVFFIGRHLMIFSFVTTSVTVMSHSEINVLFNWAKYQVFFHLEISVFHEQLSNDSLYSAIQRKTEEVSVV
jgi:hypothetical protein